jgi:hypothetical protein
VRARAVYADRDDQGVPGCIGGGARGKLRGAARWWLKGSSAALSKQDEELVTQLRAGGCPEEEIAKLVAQEGGDEDYQVWPENADAARAFLFCATQWRVAPVTMAVGLGGGVTRLVWLGLDYQAVKIAFEVEPPKDLADAWWGLRVIESEAMVLRNEANAD